MEPDTVCQTYPSTLLANDCASYYSLHKDDPAHKEMSTRQTNSRLSSEAGQAVPTSRKTHQSAINNKPGSKVKRRGWQEPTDMKHYYKFYYGGESTENAMYKDLSNTTYHNSWNKDYEKYQNLHQFEDIAGSL